MGSEWPKLLGSRVKKAGADWLRHRLIGVRGLSGGGRGLGDLAALQEDIPADAGEEEKRGGDLAGLGDGGGRWSEIRCSEGLRKKLGNSSTGLVDALPEADITNEVAIAPAAV